MARALVRLRRSDTADPFVLSAVFLATETTLEGLPAPDSEAALIDLEAALSLAERLVKDPSEQEIATYEDWA